MKYLNWFLVLGVLVVPQLVSAAPYISSVGGPSTLVVGQSGSWTVTANSSDDARFNFNPGDDSPVISKSITKSATVTSATFSYTYSRPGTYTARFTVTDSTGTSAESTKSIRVNDLPASISNINIQGHQATWMYQETVKNISWSYSNIPTDRDLKFRYGAWNTADGEWINDATVPVTKSSGTATGRQTANMRNIANINKPAVIRVALVDANGNLYKINDSLVQSTGTQTFTIKRRGQANVTIDSSSFSEQSGAFRGQTNVALVKSDIVLSVTATNGDVYVHPHGANISVKNSRDQVVSIPNGDIDRLGTIKINGVDSTNPSATAQFVGLKQGGGHIFKVAAGKTEKFHITQTFKKDKLSAPEEYKAVLNSIEVGELESTNLSQKPINSILSGRVSLTLAPVVWTVSPAVLNRGANLLIDGVALQGKKIIISGVNQNTISPVYTNIAGGVRASLSTAGFVPGQYSLQVEGVTGSWNFTVTAPAVPAPTVPKITAVVVNDFITRWGNNSFKDIVVVYEGIPNGKKIKLGIYSDLNGGSYIGPLSYYNIKNNGFIVINKKPDIPTSMLGREYYLKAVVVDSGNYDYRYGGNLVQVNSVNRFVIDGTSAMADEENQLANSEEATKSLWDRFVEWLI